MNTTSDLTEALSRIGDSAKTAKVSPRKLAQIVRATNCTTGIGGAKTGNALKIAFTRISDEMALKTIESMGVKRGKTGLHTLRNLMLRYDAMTSDDRHEVVEMLGGIYEINVIKAALQS